MGTGNWAKSHAIQVKSENSLRIVIEPCPVLLCASSRITEIRTISLSKMKNVTQITGRIKCGGSYDCPIFSQEKEGLPCVGEITRQQETGRTIKKKILLYNVSNYIRP
jgi:hypothetical protein